MAGRKSKLWEWLMEDVSLLSPSNKRQSKFWKWFNPQGFSNKTISIVTILGILMWAFVIHYGNLVESKYDSDIKEIDLEICELMKQQLRYTAPNSPDALEIKLELHELDKEIPSCIDEEFRAAHTMNELVFK